MKFVKKFIGILRKIVIFSKESFLNDITCKNIYKYNDLIIHF